MRFRDANFYNYKVRLDDNTKNFVRHQSNIVVAEQLQMLEKIDEVRELLNEISYTANRSVMHHSNIVHDLGEDAFGEEFTITLREDVENGEDGSLGGTTEESESVEEEANSLVEEEPRLNVMLLTEIEVGDTVVCVGGTKHGESMYCTVVQISDSKKTFILQDSSGNIFRKWKKNVQKVLK